MRIIGIENSNGNPVYIVQVGENRFVDIVYCKNDYFINITGKNNAKEIVYDNDGHCFAFDGDAQTIIDFVKRFVEVNTDEPKNKPVVLYWPSAIVKRSPDSNPELQYTSMGELSLEKAMEMINFFKSQYIVISAWIDTHENGKKQTVFHECYLDAFGNAVAYPY